MDLKTTYLGLELQHPLMPGASPMVLDFDRLRRLEDAGAAAVVMNSLFEEQIIGEEVATYHTMEMHEGASGEASSYLPEPPDFQLGPDEYLEHVRKVKAAVKVPVIGSLNGTTRGGWLEYARLIQEAGADALELNVYELQTDFNESGERVEDRAIDVIRAIKQAVTIPVSVKLSPFYSSLSNFARQLDHTGVDGLVLFNRFYQPDINVEELEVERTLHLSNSSELPLRLRWLAILSGRVRPSLAVSGGVHTPLDVVKSIMAGAHAVQVVSALLQRGPEYIRVLRGELARFLEEHEYESLKQMRGNMDLMACPDPKAYERANYMHLLQSWKF
ncbi:MAG: dihydroorotate dehydrogenase-like protein [Thermoanaerobaculia bacterium]|nr:NAD-dependent dihydropyrimidine dehydrogenase subunit PreA [Thermoanaerobaculia bacterium]MCK6681754.1 dihydroorotate dehydrogenase-like protein [Thermoanaerobaculia bacterium]